MKPCCGCFNHIVAADMFEVAVVIRGLYNSTKHLTSDTHGEMYIHVSISYALS